MRVGGGIPISRSPFLAGVLSLLVPGLGQIYAGKGERGAAILIAAIVVGNLNAIWLSLHATASSGPYTFWGHTLPRILHDLFAAWGLVFLMWQLVDAYKQARPPEDKTGGVDGFADEEQGLGIDGNEEDAL